MSSILLYSILFYYTIFHALPPRIGRVAPGNFASQDFVCFLHYFRGSSIFGSVFFVAEVPRWPSCMFSVPFSRKYVILLRHFCGESQRFDLQRLPFPPLVKRPTCIAEICGDDESARKQCRQISNPGSWNIIYKVTNSHHNYYLIIQIMILIMS